MKIEMKPGEREGEFVVTAPYAPEMFRLAGDLKLNGRWSEKDGEWRFHKCDEARLRYALFQVYGTDGRPVPSRTVRFRLEEYDNRPMYLLGRVIVDRPDPDKPVEFGEGVVLVEGKFNPMGQCLYNADPSILEPVTLEIRDVPVHIADVAIAVGLVMPADE